MDSRTQRAGAQSQRRRVPAWLVAIVAVLVLLAIGGGTLAWYLTDQAARPVQAATRFCTDLRTQRYDRAYLLLSPALQSATTATNFIRDMQLHDKIDGTVQHCGLTAHASALSLGIGATATTVSISLQRSKTYSGQLALAKHGDAWTVAQIATSLQGTDVVPIELGTDFCAALVAKQYASAYSHFSLGFQQRIDQTTYTQTLTAALAQAGATIQTCQAQLPSYSVASSDQAAQLTIVLNVAVGGTQVPEPESLSFVHDGGTWKIDNIA